MTSEFAPTLGRLERSQRGIGRIDEPGGDGGREDDPGLRGLGTEAEGADNPSDSERRIDVTEPQLQFLFLLLTERDAQLVGELAGGRVAGDDRSVRRCYH